jgi:PII-like signaling protein
VPEVPPPYRTVASLIASAAIVDRPSFTRKTWVCDGGWQEYRRDLRSMSGEPGSLVGAVNVESGLCAPAALPGTGETGMALWHKLMVYTSEAAQFHGQPIHRAIVRRLRAAGISGATTVRGVWGFHGDHAQHGDRLLQLGRHVPAVTIVVDTPDRIAAAFAAIDELTAEQGLVTSETVPATRAGAGPAVSPAA